MKKKISIKNLYLIALISIGLIGLGIGSTYAVFTAKATIDNPIAFTSTLSYTSDVIETVEVTIAPGETKYTTLDITNSNDTALNYAVWYIDEGKDIDLGVDIEQATEDMCPNITTCTGFESGTPAIVAVLIRNNTSSTITVTVGVSASSGDIVLGEDMTIFPNQELTAATTALSNFIYVLGTTSTTVDSINYYDETTAAYYDISITPITIASDEILLIRYNGTEEMVNIPDTYTIDGVTYKTVVLSSAYISHYDSTTGADIDDDTGVFMYNDLITEVGFGDSVRFVSYDYGETYADNSMYMLFDGCTSLTTISNIPTTVNDMSYAFIDCELLENIATLPNSVLVMYGTFQNCNSITTAPEFPLFVTDISSAYRGCHNLATVPTIPGSVVNMNKTFLNCPALTGTINIEATEVSDVEYIFDGTSETINVIAPAGSTTYTSLAALGTEDGMPSNVTLTTSGSSTTTYSAQIIRTVDGANQATVATRTITAGTSDTEAVVVEGTLFTAQYTSISCTNGQTATVTVTEGDYYQIAHVTVNNITADTVCTVAFNTE